MISFSLRCIGIAITMVTSLSTLADSLDVDNTNGSPTHSKCNGSFHGVPIAPDAKYCQSFDGEQPVSFVYFSPNSIADIVNFYHKTDNNYAETVTVQSRIVLTPVDANHRLIVSPDNKGTQVDILVFD